MRRFRLRSGASRRGRHDAAPTRVSPGTGPYPCIVKKPIPSFAIAAAPLSVAALALNGSGDPEPLAVALAPPAPPEPEPAPPRGPYTGALLAEFTHVRHRLAWPRRRARALPPRHSLAARIRTRVVASASPGGRAFARLAPRTAFGSPRVLPVAKRHGRWLRVVADLPGRRSGWIRWARPAVELQAHRFELVADRSRRTLTVIDRGRAVKRLDVAVGRSGSPTPLGRFAVTDRLSGTPYGGAYGCCVLALSGHQRHLPAGWTGGDRLAIHATGRPTPSAGGSAGCVVGSNSSLRYLMRRIPLGTLVTIRR
jgi:L,D-transpeptidase-like protein